MPAPIVAGLVAAALASGPAQGASAAERPAPTHRAVYWYDRSDPRGTFRSQVYDLRRGEDTDRIDAWLELLRTRYPHYRAYARPVVVSDWPGRDDAERLAAARTDEYQQAVLAFTRSRLAEIRAVVPLDPTLLPGGSASPGMGPPPLSPAGPFRDANRFRARPPLELGPATAPFPVPVPFSRPHP